MKCRRLIFGAVVGTLLLAQLSPAARTEAFANNLPRHSLAPLVRRVLPSIVEVWAKVSAPQNIPVDPAAGFPDVPPSPGKIVYGAGVIVAADGLIITCNHVIEGAEAVKVTLSDGRRFNATTLLADKDSDVAVLTIAAAGLPPLAFGSSADVQPGDFVIAIGAPLGQGQSVSFGIVSALHRDYAGTNHADLIQTDALLNPGNSGGPLLTLNGELIGINTARFGEYGGDRGFGFAIPVDQVRSIVSKTAKAGL